MTLLIMSEDRRCRLLQALKSLDTEILEATNCHKARQLLETRPPVEVVVTDATLSDGNWRDTVKYVVDHGIDASVVLTCSGADEKLWSEALWRGVYDLLVEPYEFHEVCWVIGGALRTARESALMRAAEGVISSGYFRSASG